MTDRASRKRREKPEATNIPAESEGRPPAGDPAFSAASQGLSPADDEPGDSAPYQLPDGSWEVLTLSETGAVTGRRAVEGPK